MNLVTLSQTPSVPSLVASAGDAASRRFVEFFATQIRNKGTRYQYRNAVNDFFDWCEKHDIDFFHIEPIVIAAYIESLMQYLSPPTVKLRLAALRMMYDFLVTGHIVRVNPALSVRGPRHVVTTGKTPVLTAEETRELLDSIDTSTIAGLRDRALIGVMVFSFARVSATLGMNVEDCFLQGRRMWFRLYEKGSKHITIPAHHYAEEYVDAYLAAAGSVEKKTPLFRTLGRNKHLTTKRMNRTDALKMIKRRATRAGLPDTICNHSFRATGITNYLGNGGSLEHAMKIAAHASAKTTKLYDRTNDEVSLDEIERIRI